MIMKRFGRKNRTAEERVKSAKFRIMNEDLYTLSTKDSHELFAQHPELFDEYHAQFRAETLKWKVNPVDLFVEALEQNNELSRPLFPVEGKTIIDVGCGDAIISERFPELRIASFDLVKQNDRVTIANAEALPLSDNSIDLAMYSLSLMGNPTGMLREASRVLKLGGLLWVAEVGSRCSPDCFKTQMEECGFYQYYCKDLNYFWIQGFIKQAEFKRAYTIKMEPCTYKRR